MLKSAAAFAIAFSISCAGYLYSKSLETRVKKLEKILLLLSQIKTAIEFTADSVETIFSSLSESEDFAALPFVSDCLERMKRGADFFSGWNEALNEKENIFPLKKEDTALLASFGSSLGATDSAGQMRNCEMHERLFEERLRGAIADKDNLSKPARTVGLLTGAVVLIICL